MPMSQELGTTSLLDLVARFQGGFPVLAGQAQTGDVLQNGLIRLSRSLLHP